MEREVIQVFAGLFAALVAASLVGWWLARRRPSQVVDNLNARVRAWWVMIAVGGIALWLGHSAVIVLFALLSWFSLREFAPDAWWLRVAVPVQYVALVAGLWWAVALAIPLACLIVRGSELRLGLLLCVYGLSWIPMLPRLEWMFYLVLVVQACDVLQYLWGHAIGRHAVAPRISPGKTVEGLLGGVASATALGASLHYLMPFGPVPAMLLSLAATLAGFAGGLLFSAVKRRRGIKDWGTAIAGHGGVLDRVDSLCLAAPVFYVAVRWFGA